jgi:hypothetical protein
VSMGFLRGETCAEMLLPAHLHAESGLAYALLLKLDGGEQRAHGLCSES